MDIELNFDPDTHTYKVGNVVMPSVTTLLQPLYDFRFVNPETLQRAADFGTAVHRVCELYDLDDLVMDSVDRAISPYLRAWQQFLSEMSVKIIEVEKRYHHTALGYAGTLDRILLVNGRPSLTDIKTVSALSPAVGIQLAGYQGLLSANTSYKTISRAAVQLCGDGSYKYRTYADAMDWPAFLSLLTLNNWRTKNAA